MELTMDLFQICTYEFPAQLMARQLLSLFQLFGLFFSSSQQMWIPNKNFAQECVSHMRMTYGVRARSALG